MINYGIFFIIIFISLILFLFDIKKFLYSIFICYPIAAQMVSTSINVFGFSMNLSMIYGSLIFLICLIQTMKIIFSSDENKHIDPFLLFVILGFFILCLVSLPFSVNKYHTIVAVTKVFTWILLLFISINLFRQKEELFTLSYIAMVGVLIIIVSFMLSKYGIYGNLNYDYVAQDILVPSGEFFNQINIVYPLVVAIPILMIGVYLRINKGLFIPILLFTLLVALLTFVRAPIVALAFGYLVFIFYLGRYKIIDISKNLVFGALIIMLAVMAFVYLNPQSALTRWSQPKEQIERGDIEHLGSGRLGFLINGIHYYFGEQGLVKQLLGNGIGTSYIVNNYQKVVHNGFMEILIGCGLLGLLIYLAFLIRIHSILVRIIRFSQEKDLKLLSCLSIMGFMIILCAHFDVILFSVFPMSFFAIHIGATIGMGWKQIKTFDRSGIALT